MNSYSKMYETDFPDLKTKADTVYNLKQGMGAISPRFFEYP